MIMNQYVFGSLSAFILLSNNFLKSIVDQWIEFYNHELETPHNSVLAHVFGYRKAASKEVLF